MNKTISIAMCTFNGSKYLSNQIDSILCQTIEADEIVIVDDCSTDETIDILQNYSILCDKIRIFKNDYTLGPINNFEKAARLCSGDYIFFSDQDDVWLPNKIEFMIEAIGSGDFLYSDAQIIDVVGNIIQESELKYHQVKPCPPRDPFYFFTNNCVSGHNLLVTKRFIENSFPFPKNVMYDQWLALLASVASGIKFLPMPLCQHRIHRSNFTNNLKFDAVKRRGSKARGYSWSSRKSRIYKRFYFQKELLERLINIIPDCYEFKNEFLLLHDHFVNFDKCFFNFKLFLSLYKIRKHILLQDSYLLKMKKLKKYSSGGLSYLLPIV